MGKMSVFGDGRSHMNDLYDSLDIFIEQGGTLSEFFQVMEYFFSNYDKKLKEVGK